MSRRFGSRRIRPARYVLALLPLLAALGGTARAEEPMRVFAAGSLTGAFTEMVQAFGAPPGVVAPPVFGPSGLLRQRIEAGEPADVFASANMGHPASLAARRPGVAVTPFVRNRLCVLGMQRLGLEPGVLLDRMLDPALVLATSTPRADPSGDYAWAVFARAEQVRPGAKASLEAKARTLVGGPGMVPAVPGRSAAAGLFLAGQADLYLGYCSGAAGIQAEVPGLAAVPLPPPLAPEGADRPEYGMVVLTGSDTARRFAAFVLSPAGQAILAAHGFEPASPP